MEKTLRSKVIFRGRILTLRQDEVELPNGRTSSREILLHPGAVAVVPLLSPKEIILIRQFRKALEKVIYEIPAGTLEPGEDPISCAQRELGEEIGYRATKLTPLLSFYPAPGYCNELIHLFLAEGLKKTVRRPESDEQIEPVTATAEEVQQWIRRGEIQDSKTLIGIAAWRGLFQ